MNCKDYHCSANKVMLRRVYQLTPILALWFSVCFHPVVYASASVIAIPDMGVFAAPTVQPIRAVAPPNPFSGLDYATKSSIFDTRMVQSRALGYEAQANVAREYVRAGRFAGHPSLGRRLANFEASGRVNLNDPGVIANIKRLGVLNRQVADGAVRELVYYQKLYNNPAFFRHLRMGTPVPTLRGGLSDMDLHYFDVLGRPVWVEIKNNRQLTLEPRIQLQLERMGSFTGRKVLVCRGSVAPAVKQVAARHGVEIMENVRSQDLVSALARADIQALKIRGGTSIAGGVLLAGFGIYSAYSRLDAANWMVDDYVRRGLTGDAILTAAGGAAIARGAILWHQAATAASGSAKAGAAGALKGAGSGTAQGVGAGAALGGGAVWVRVLGPTSWVLMTAYAGHTGYRLYVGDVDPRSGTVQLTGLGGAMAGGIAGGKTGALIGSPLGPKGTVVGGLAGGAVGGIGGFFGGSAVGVMGYEHFVFSNAEFAAQKLAILEASLQ